MNKKRITSITLITFVAILAVSLGYMAFNKKLSSPAPAPVPIPAPNPATEPTPLPITEPVPTKTMIPFTLGEEFILGKNQIAQLINSGLEIEIMQFYNSPCPAGAQCIWSGLGVTLQYSLDGQVLSGIDLSQAFGYQTVIGKTDYTTFVNLMVEKMK